MSEPEPTILDHAPIDTEQQCPMHRGDDRPEPCTNTAEYVFVYDGNVNPDDGVNLKNCLACEDCVPVRSEKLA